MAYRTGVAQTVPNPAGAEPPRTLAPSAAPVIPAYAGIRILGLFPASAGSTGS